MDQSQIFYAKRQKLANCFNFLCPFTSFFFFVCTAVQEIEKVWELPNIEVMKSKGMQCRRSPASIT